MALSRTVPTKVAAKDRSAVASATTPATKSDTVTTATLVRGKTYVWKNIHYKVNNPVVVEDATALELEQLYQEVRDADGELYEKPYFDIQRNVPRPVEEVSGPTPRRLALRR
jgi:hypothetical protein